MAGNVSNLGEQRLANLMVNATSYTPENLILRLYANDVTPASSYSIANFTEAAFPGYAAVTLSSAGWNVYQGNPTSAIYSTDATFTVAGSTTNSLVYGYYLSGTNTSDLYGAERFAAAPYQLSLIGDKVAVRPTLMIGAGDILATGLLHWWHHSESSGTGNRADAVGTSTLNYQGTGDLSSIVGISGPATQTLEDNCYLNAGVLAMTGDFSMSFWFRPTAAPSETYVSDGSGNVIAKVTFDYDASDLLQFQFRDPQTGGPLTFSGDTAYTVGQWGLVVLRYRASTKVWTARWYGFATGNATNYSSSAATNAPLSPGTMTLGKDTVSVPFFAKTLGHDEMGFWGRYLTDAECDRLSLPSVYPFASFGANVDSVLIQPGGSQTFPGFSLDVTLQVFPRGPNRDARLYWKPNTASSSAYSLVGAATYNPSSSDYDITWIFPSCTELPPGLPDTQQASLKAIVFGADQIAQTDQNNSYALTGRGC